MGREVLCRGLCRRLMHDRPGCRQLRHEAGGGVVEYRGCQSLGLNLGLEVVVEVSKELSRGAGVGGTHRQGEIVQGGTAKHCVCLVARALQSDSTGCYDAQS